MASGVSYMKPISYQDNNKSSNSVTYYGLRTRRCSISLILKTVVPGFVRSALPRTSLQAQILGSNPAYWIRSSDGWEEVGKQHVLTNPNLCWSFRWELTSNSSVMNVFFCFPHRWQRVCSFKIWGKLQGTHQQTQSFYAQAVWEST